MSASPQKCAACRETIERTEGSWRIDSKDYHLECVEERPVLIVPRTKEQRMEVRNKRLAERRLKEDAES